ncbi:MAG: hypothetical protein KGI54_15000 [Pseudomonadota bacterium]|nr:hypothetical protein [Pseudomonadota bacterium]
MTTYSIHTNLDPSQLTNVAVEIYRQWLNFAVGKGEIGGKYLKNPSGRYANAISWKKTGEYQITIMADSSVSKEVDSIENGVPAYNLKEKMLSEKSRTSKDGYRYRIVRMPPDERGKAYVPGSGDVLLGSPIDTIIKNSTKGQRTKVPAKVGKIWAKKNERTDFKTMTDAPGSSPWIIPERIAYSPAKILSELIQNKYGK